MKKATFLAVAAAVLLFASGAKAQDVFTASGTPIYSNGAAWFPLLTFDGNPANGHMKDLADSTWEFDLPSYSVTGCNLTVQTVVRNVTGTGYTDTYTTNFSCAGYSVQTVQDKKYVKVWCRFRACYTGAPGSPFPITGTVTALTARNMFDNSVVTVG